MQNRPNFKIGVGKAIPSISLWFELFFSFGTGFGTRPFHRKFGPLVGLVGIMGPNP